MKRIQHEESSHEKSATQKKWNMNAARKRAKRVKHEENMKTERNSNVLNERDTKKCKMKNVQHEENMKSERNSKTLKRAMQKMYMERAQHEEMMQHEKNHSDRAKFGKKCKRRAHYRAQTNNKPSVNEMLYTGQNYCFSYFLKTILDAYLQKHSYYTFFHSCPVTLSHHFSMTFNPVVVWVFPFFSLK